MWSAVAEPALYTHFFGLDIGDGVRQAQEMDKPVIVCGKTFSKKSMNGSLNPHKNRQDYPRHGRYGVRSHQVLDSESANLLIFANSHRSGPAFFLDGPCKGLPAVFDIA